MRCNAAKNAGRCWHTWSRVPDHLETTAANRSSAPGVRPLKNGSAANVSANASQCWCSRYRVPARSCSRPFPLVASVQRSG